MSPFDMYSNITFKHIKSFIMYEFLLDGVLTKIIKISSCNVETFNTPQVVRNIL